MMLTWLPHSARIIYGLNLGKDVSMYYKKQKIGKKWYPRSFTAGTYGTKYVAERLSEMSTVSKGDTYAVLMGLGEVLGDMMEMGNTVKLDGLGTFYLVGNANGQGVDTPEEVSPEQFRTPCGDKCTKIC